MMRLLVAKTLHVLAAQVRRADEAFVPRPEAEKKGAKRKPEAHDDADDSW